MARKLASIRKIHKIESIPNADQIELAHIDGWQCVVKRGEFRPQENGVYFEIDSFLPIEPRYEFLRKSSYRKLPDGKEGFRLKTVKLRGTLSQGLLLPLSLFPTLKNLTEGTEVTEFLNIQKYEPPIPTQLSGRVRGMLPTFIQKTDQERIQNIPEVLMEYFETPFDVSVKLDGSSMTAYFYEGHYGVCSRNLELLEDEDNLFWKISRKYHLREILTSWGKNLAFQGEVVGEGIQKNAEEIQGNRFCLFDIWDIDQQRHWTRQEIATLRFPSEYPLEWVPILATNKTLKELLEKKQTESLETQAVRLNTILNFSKGKKALSARGQREGVVFRSSKLHHNAIISFKVINNDYLLDEKDF